MRDPDTKAYTYRVRPADEWIEVNASDLRIVPQDLWDRVQTRLTLNDHLRGPQSQRAIGKYLLSGFMKCGVCGGPYSKENHSYRCANHHNRGDRACTNKRGITVERLQRVVIAALREHLYTPANLKVIIAEVRDHLLARAKQASQMRRSSDRDKQLREIEREIEHIKQAVKIGKATTTLLGMLEDAERRRAALQGGQAASGRDDMAARLEKVLAQLPDRVQAILEDLETLLASGHVARGKDILAALGTEIIISPEGTAEIRGDLRKALTLVSGQRDKSMVAWLGEEDSNPR